MNTGCIGYIERIKQLKSEKKITNDKLAEMTGIPLGTISKILAGISDSPKLSNIVLIANALGCSLDYLVSGTPRNDNNYTLNTEEMNLVEDFRKLDTHGKELTALVIRKELERLSGAFAEISSASEIKSKAVSATKQAKILSPISSVTAVTGMEKRAMLLYDLPVSAGPGVYLDDAAATEIQIPDNEKTRLADFALRISGNSMEPKYHDGDVILVQDTDSLEVGELGIFILDGNGYFKKYGGDRLISLNPEYGEILLKEYAEAVCCGRAVGKLKRK